MTARPILDGLRPAALALIALLALVGAACSSSAADEASLPAGAQQLTVTVGDSLGYEPAALTVQSGRVVALTVRNTGATEHDLTIMGIPAQDVKNAMQGAQGHGQGMEMSGGMTMVVAHPRVKSTATARFTPTTPGTYEYYCTLPGHRDAGMRGTLTVT